MDTNNIEHPFYLNRQTAKQILDIPNESIVNMSTYSRTADIYSSNLEYLKNSSLNNCKTPACGVGHLAFQNGYPEEFIRISKVTLRTNFNYESYRSSLTNDVKTDIFLFNANWIDSLENLKARAKYVYENGTAPLKYKPFEYGSHTYA